MAAGATTNTFGIDGVADHGFPIYDLADSIRLRNHVLERFEAADADAGEIDRGALTFVAVGGGPTGVELAGALAELFDVVLRKDFRRLGRGAAVAELPFRIKLTGTPAWLAWLGLHLVFLVGFRNRLSVFLNWAWNYLTCDRGPRLILRTDRLADGLAEGSERGNRHPPVPDHSTVTARSTSS